LDFSLLHPFWAIGLPIAGSLPLGWWMARALDPRGDRVGQGLDAAPLALLRLLGQSEPAKMGWKKYAFSLLTFNAALFVLSFVILLSQGYLPLLNPNARGPLTALGFKDFSGVEHPGADPAVIFNTVCSFVTNTNLQHYSGEQHLSYFSQLGAIVWLQFVTPACGIGAMLAVVRGLRGERDLGDFYLDMIRGLILVLIPLSLVVAVLLVATGVPMTFAANAKASTVERSEQTIAVGPVAAEVAIKQLGTNGGGYFGPNSAHPFENPSPWSNLIEVISIIIVPMASIVMFGRMIKDRAHAVVIYGVMMVLLLVGATVAIYAETSRARRLPAWRSQGAATWRGRKCALGPSPRRPGQRSPRPLPMARSMPCTTASNRWAGWFPWP